jgi:hypothetical protein
MIRTKLPKKRTLPLSVDLLQFLFTQEEPADLILLCTFYCYIAVLQNTNTPRITIAVTAGALGWSDRRVKYTQQQLKTLHILGDTANNNHVKLSFLPSNFTDNGGGGRFRLPNDSVIYNITSSISKGCTLQETSSPNKRITASMFDQFWSIYPRKTDKGKALSKWLQVCKRKDAPTWREVKRAILQQKQSERWQESMFIPMPATWLNQRRWLDDPSEMKKIDFNQPVSGPAFVIDDGRRYDRCKDGEYRNAAGEIYIP